MQAGVLLGVSDTGIGMTPEQLEVDENTGIQH